MEIPGFRITEDLRKGQRLALFRGVRLSDREPVLIKIRELDYAAFDKEQRLLRDLDLPGLPRPLELFSLQGSQVSVFADFRGYPAGPELPLAGFLVLAEELAHTLAGIHRAGLIAGAIDPESVLFDPASGQILLTDLSLAEAAPAANGARRSAPPDAAPLAYISPELTGRVARAADERSDLYSLGAALYEFLTRQAPFTETDPLELIHKHVASVPARPSSVRPGIPDAVSLIIEKLLEKHPAKRYQTAEGAASDLRRCSDELRSNGSVAVFRLGTDDVSNRFEIPGGLYGRTKETDEIASVFAQIADGPPAILLVGGYPGIGKTSLIEELGGLVSSKGGNFITGKFDLVARGVPFGALIEAIGDLVRNLLTLDDEALAQVRERIAGSLGANRAVLTDVVPDLELLIGRQQPALGLGPQETLNRLQLVFQRFLSSVATEEHPLVLFLDDLQWADAATLDLLLPLLGGSSSARHFLLVGAYRDNEIDAKHPLARTIAELESSGVSLHRLTLGPLEREDLEHLVSDTLRTDPRRSNELAEVVWEKTAGNPFFVIQFLSTLRQEDLLWFDYDARCWNYDRAAISRAGLTDNVVDLMTRKIERLSAETRRALQLASCIGNRFSVRMLSVVGGMKTSEVRRDLTSALEAGLIETADSVGGSEVFTFLHDRVQQAAHELLSDNRRRMGHLTVGRLLASTLDEDRLEEELFDVVNHLNLGRELITDEAERERLAELNLRAGLKARKSAAFDAALGYFRTGSDLLAGTGRYELDFELRLGAAECGYLCGDLDEDGSAASALLELAGSDLDRARVLNLKMIRFENQGMYPEAVRTALECLDLFGISFPSTDDAKRTALDRELDEIDELIGGRPISGLVDLPESQDPAMRMVMNILTDIWSSTYITGDELLARLISATIVRISLTHGCAAESAYGYVTHAITVGPVLGDYVAALEFGKLALAVNERFDDARRRAKIHQQFHAHVALWRMPFSVCAAHAREAARSGLEAGDFLYASYGTMTESWSAFQIAEDLEEFAAAYAPGLDLIRKLKVDSFADGHSLLLNRALALTGKTDSPTSLNGAGFDEAEYERAYAGNPFFSTFLGVARLELLYTFGEFDAALLQYRQVAPLVQHVAGTIWPVLLDIWGGLTLAANAMGPGLNDRDLLLKEAEASSERLEKLSENCPQNYLVHSLLLKAEIASAFGREGDAVGFYERAVRFSAEQGTVREKALSYELFGRYWAERGSDLLASACLREAVGQYSVLKAFPKSAEIRDRFGAILSRSKTRDGSEAEGLDAASVIKAAQALSVEIDLEQIVANLLRIVTENAGAERAVLFMAREGRLAAVAELAGTGARMMLDSPVGLADLETVPRSLLNFTHRTLEEVIADDGGRNTRYENDPYMVRFAPGSAMTVPLIGRGVLKGILYLENRLTKGAFTEDRVEVCRVLASQAAIPLENASLYREMRIESDQRRKAEETLRSITEGTAAVTGDSFFASLAKHLADAVGAGFAFVTEFRREEEEEAKMLAFWKKDRLAENSAYSVKGTPCERVFHGETCFYPEGIQELFPEDTDLQEIGAEGYWGVPLRGADGSVIGHLAVLDDRPLTETEQGRSLLEIFAARAGAELERLHAERELQNALAELETLKVRLEDENIYLREEIRQSHNFEEIVGESPALLKTLQDVERVAPTDATVLVTGETGTGKELIARAVHERSGRKDRPLVKVNCAAISAGLVESELFGHTKGAFTGAVEKRSGRFELADGGTIFLDEVGELPPETQVKILRVLQEGEFEPVGSSKTLKVDVRLIAATNRDLEEEIAAGRFRSDLFYRLNVFPVRVPALRERMEDLPALVTFFLDRYAKAFGRNLKAVPNGVLRMLSEYDWPGNVRELQNLIERAVVLAPPELESLRAELLPVGTARAAAAGADSQSGVTAPRRSTYSPAGESMEDIERSHILSVLENTGWVIAGDKGAAGVLDLHPNTLRSRMKKLGIRRPGKS